MNTDVKQMTDEEILARIIELGFEGELDRFEAFCDELRNGLPPGTGVVLRGSVVTDERWEDGAPFDANGKGTSDLDVALVGSEVMKHWQDDAYYIPLLHTKPLSDEHPDIAPSLNPLRQALQNLVRRPVNFQATANLVLFVRDVLLDQPHFTLIKADETS
jgi:hypothetical protein